MRKSTLFEDATQATAKKKLNGMNQNTTERDGKREKIL